MMRILQGRAAQAQVTKLTVRSQQASQKVRAVRRIISDVRRRGDVAVREYARTWDGLGVRPLRVSSSEMRQAWRSLGKELRTSFEIASSNIRSFAEQQKPRGWMRKNKGLTVGQVVRPLDSVGCYVPGGRYPLLSTLMMTVIPAQIAGVPRICVVSPNPQRELLAVAHALGVSEFYRIGGAQAIATLAYGTRSIPRVNKIVGPGNAYVTTAKMLVAFDCSIDMLAGPTEIVVVSDDGNPDWIASDLVAQSEHDVDAIAILITCSQSLAERTIECAVRRCEGNPVAHRSLRKNGLIFIARNPSEALDWANQLAPEHITVSEKDVDKVRNAGSIFVGDYSPQAAGDYATGPNHVLPTGGTTRFRGGLTVSDFVKIVTVQKLSRNGLRRLAPTITTLAESENLKAHAQSIRARFPNA